MDAKDLFPSSDYLKSPDVIDAGGEMTLTIKSVSRKEYDNNGKKEVKGLLTFVETSKQLTTNVTNNNALIAMYGSSNIDVAWVGKQITLYVDHNVKGPNGIVDGIRIRNVSGIEALAAKYWAVVAEHFLTPDEGRAILKQDDVKGDYAKAIEVLNGDFPS